MMGFGEAYGRSHEFSTGKLHGIREGLSDLDASVACIVTFGSYARREASSASDMDFLIIEKDSENISNKAYENIVKIINKYVEIEPSKDGSFGQKIKVNDLLNNIGGMKDDNANLTRRMLFLLEGDFLSNEYEFRQIRNNIVDIYVPERIRDHSLALFLLNDIIRYWRTITVDYSYKTETGDKPWAIRNLKLVFSRKLMYAGGIFSIAMTADRDFSEKRRLLKELFDMPALERLSHICGDEKCKKVIEIYNNFLSNIEDQVIRDQLNKIPLHDHKNALFRSLKNDSYRFNRELLLLIERVFHHSHPIHRALVY